jgi:putative endonuclease
MKYFVYIVRCADNTFYTGITTDINRRIDEHNGKDKGAKYTRMRQPIKLMYATEFPDRSTASKEECRIKKMTHKQKEILIKK